MKKGLFFILISIIMTLFFSCISFGGTAPFEMVGDENNPAENNAVIKFVSDTEDGWIQLLEWNNIDLAERLYRGLGTSSEHTAKLTIPAGTNSFVFDIIYSIEVFNVRYNYPYESIELQYNLEPGRMYMFKGRSQRKDLLRREFYVEIYDTTDGSELLKEWKIGES